MEANAEEVMDKDEVMPADKDKVPTTTPTILTITTTMRDEKALQEDMVEDVQSWGTINLQLSATIATSLGIMLENVEHPRTKLMRESTT